VIGDQVEVEWVDYDQPIPYTITEAGRQALLEWDIDHHPSNCRHEFKWADGHLECRGCGQVRNLPRTQSIPSYLRPKGRND